MRTWAAGCVLAALALGAPAQTYVVPEELWDRPRSAAQVLKQTEVREAVRAQLAQPSSYLLVRHGDGREAALRAEELRGWLIALAVEPGRIVLRRDPAVSRTLRLDVRVDEPGK